MVRDETRETILVVDDDAEIVRLVSAYVEQAGYAVMKAYDGASAIDLIWDNQPSLVVLDLMLPDYSGWEITRIIRDEPTLKEIPIIMLTARIEDEDKINGLEMGADDYVTKPFNPREVVARVRSVLRRVKNGAAHTAEKVQSIKRHELKLDLYRREVMLRGKPIEVTPTEFELLRALMQNPGYAFTRSELIERSLGYGYESLERSLDSHIKNLRKKIEDDPRDPLYIETVYGIGYRLNEDLDT